MVQLRYANVQQGAEVLADFEAGDVYSSDVGTSPIMTNFFMWALVPAFIFQRMMRVRSFSFDNIVAKLDSLSLCPWAWERSQGGQSIKAFSREAAAANSKNAWISKLPETVSESEVDEYLPQPGEEACIVYLSSNRLSFLFQTARTFKTKLT